MTILVTGGAGFIGSNFVQYSLSVWNNEPLINLDKLTYAGNSSNLSSVLPGRDYRFVHGSIGDPRLLRGLFASDPISAIVNFAAESHVDRSISDPEIFFRTNVLDTLKLLEATREYYQSLPAPRRDRFRFLHISTDEVFGALGNDEAPFTEKSQYRPNSPYAASKAASDHIVRAYGQTHGLPVMITNCSNNYGPYQFPEKLIPLMIHRALLGDALPVYGDGNQVRDWLFVKDHCEAIHRVLANGRVGETYNLGGNCERRNIEVVQTICEVLDGERPRSDHRSYAEQIRFVKDRPGHDRRYAVDTGKAASELGWSPKESFESGIRKTVRWYLDNPSWVADVTTGAYRDWIAKQYA
jgi:dTDP-glucose 4,6-dehydratase